MTSTQWQNLVSESYYETITSTEELIKKYDYSEALIGLGYLYQNISEEDKMGIYRKEEKNLILKY